MESNDPDDYSQWPEWMQFRLLDAIAGLRDGDLEPLADYLDEASLPVCEALRAELLGMIRRDGRSPYRIAIIGETKGQRPVSLMQAQHDLEIQLGIYFVKAARAAPRGAQAGIVQGMKDDWGCAPSSAYKARAMVEDILKGKFPTLEKGVMIDFAAIEQAFPDEVRDLCSKMFPPENSEGN